MRIGGIGLSVGGEMLIHAAAHSDAFKAIVSEGGAASPSGTGTPITACGPRSSATVR